MIALVALDMAGTTIDDGGAVYRALQHSVEEAGATVAADDLQRWMGTDKVEAITNLLRLGGVDPAGDLVASTFDAFRAHLRQAYHDEPPVALPGVADAIADLRARGIKVALTTGFSDDVAEPLLDSLGWTAGDGPDHTVDAVITTSDVPAGRPAPYMIFRAMEACGAHDVRSVLVAGDTVVDVQSGRNAGAVAVGVLTGKVDRATLAAEDHDYILDSVADIPTVLTQR
ncbi:phosphonatase-like hydrolase [Mycobacterium spongiae]|uniref:Phosphonatase-like hydrolase n=1 Tax=Mycobacterium spongiae TaxID=886343 RepID=A0A975PXD4_9MYCO|nr:phosphonatase-like hydrolase [Mycobacterium spongiae]QUR68080.1 phosphonatase-like hydrolase [Mycobacterium spongiae]